MFFFFQAEDGIRDVAVTGVQTCALPISMRVYEEFAGRAASEYQVDPAVETKALIALVRSREAASPPVSRPAAASFPAPQAAAARRFMLGRGKRWVVGTIGLVLLAAVMAIRHQQANARLSQAAVGIPERATLRPDPVAYDLFLRGQIGRAHV